MQIEKITLHQYEIPLEEPFVTALKPVPELERILVEIETDEGIIGYGEAAPEYVVTGESQGSTMAVLEEILGPLILGEDPLAIERLLGEMRALVDGAPAAHAAIEIALQDIRGKYADMPVYQLLGGPAETASLTAPKVLSIKSPEEMADDAAAAVDEGYEQIKIKVGEDPETDIERVRAIDESVPDNVSLKADANQGWGDAKTALAALREIQHLLDVIEQPVAKENVAHLADLRDRLDVPVMPDESVETATDASALIQQGAGDIFNIKLMKSGGITEAVRINAVAEADGRYTQIGSMVEGQVGTAAGVHFAVAFENVIWNEMVGPFMTTDGIGNLQFDLPRIFVDSPGLGVSINRDRLEALRSDTSIVE